MSGGIVDAGAEVRAVQGCGRPRAARARSDGDGGGGRSFAPFVHGPALQPLHFDCGGGWHLLWAPELGAVNILRLAGEELISFDGCARLSKEGALEVVDSITDATPGQRETYKAIIRGEHIRRGGAE